jgi:hypothetical protein
MHHAPLSPPDAPERLQPISRQYITASSWFYQISSIYFCIWILRRVNSNLKWIDLSHYHPITEEQSCSLRQHKYMALWSLQRLEKVHIEIIPGFPIKNITVYLRNVSAWRSRNKPRIESSRKKSQLVAYTRCNKKPRWRFRTE